MKVCDLPRPLVAWEVVRGGTAVGGVSAISLQENEVHLIG